MPYATDPSLDGRLLLGAHLSFVPYYIGTVYEVRCLRCDFSAEVPTLGNVFRLEEEHKAETGERHLLDWEQKGGSVGSGSTEVEGASED